MQIYLVGGAVRDQLLALPVKEHDYVVVGATPEQMLKQGFRLVGKDFPVFLHPNTHEEYALARTERKIRPGYQGFTCYAAPDVSLEADLQRRDLTINAMAQSSDGKIIDPYHGQADIAHRYLRHVSPAFVEDPVRILRVARFMARLSPLGFRVAPETIDLMKTMVQNREISALVPERVWREFSLALTEPAPQMFIRTLSACGALAVLFPILEEHLNESQDDTDTKRSQGDGLATLKHAVALSDDPQVRFAALLCFLGKNLDLHREDNAASVLRIEHLAQQYRIPAAYTQLAILTAQYHLVCHRALELDGNALLELLKRTDAFRRIRRFKQFLLACEADFRALSHTPMHPRTVPYLQKDRLLSALSVCRTISASSVAEKGLSGSRLGQKLHDERRKQIDRLIGTN